MTSKELAATQAAEWGSGRRPLAIVSTKTPNHAHITKEMTYKKSTLFDKREKQLTATPVKQVITTEVDVPLPADWLTQERIQFHHCLKSGKGVVITLQNWGYYPPYLHYGPLLDPGTLPDGFPMPENPLGDTWTSY